MYLYIIRHGQTTGDLEDRYGGDYDDHLTDLGKDQAKKLSDKLLKSKIQKIFTSPLIRALETTQVLNEKLLAETEVVPDFRERNAYGILSGMTKTEAREKYPEQVKLLNDYKNVVIGAEDYDDLVMRIRGSLFYVCNSRKDTVAIVTHGGVIRSMFRTIFTLGETKIEDCGYALIDYRDDVFKLVSSDGINIT